MAPVTALSSKLSPSTLLTDLEVTVGGLSVGSGAEIIKGANLDPPSILTVAVKVLLLGLVVFWAVGGLLTLILVKGGYLLLLTVAQDLKSLVGSLVECCIGRQRKDDKVRLRCQGKVMKCGGDMSMDIPTLKRLLFIPQDLEDEADFKN